MAFSQAISGLNAAAANLDVIGNNIANSATYGFKSSSVAFADIFAGSKTGLGVKVADVMQDFNDGIPTNTGRGLDVAISQNGFFRLEDKSGQIVYSRNGQFKLDEQRNLVNMQGLQLTGYPALGEPPVIQQGASPVGLAVPNTLMPAKATARADMQMNLNSMDKGMDLAKFDQLNPETYNKKTSITVFDSQGNVHDISIYFIKDASKQNSWEVRSLDNSDPTATVGNVKTLTFDNNGKLQNPDQLGTVTTSAINGANAVTFDFGFGNSMQQNTGDNYVLANSQDGYKPGNLVSYHINNDGTLVGQYSNEQSQMLGQIVLTNFANPGGLSSQGDNAWKETRSSGAAILGTAGNGNFGLLTSGALEASNVDLSKELVNMIVAQRNYQSNAQTIKTQDQILNNLVNLR